MILMGKGRTEQGKDAIAQRLRHIPLIAMHGVHHQLQRWVNDGSRLFRIKSFDQGRRAFEVGKEGGDGFAFAVCTCHGLPLPPARRECVRPGGVAYN